MCLAEDIVEVIGSMNGKQHKYSCLLLNIPLTNICLQLNVAGLRNLRKICYEGYHSNFDQTKCN